MSTYTAGGNAIPANSDIIINPNQIATGDYIIHYKVPAITFRLLAPQTIQGVIEGWTKIKNTTANPGDQITDITGVSIDTTSGDIFVAVHVSLVPVTTITDSKGNQIPIQVEQAGVNPIRVLGIVAILFATLGVILVLVAVYKTTESVVGGPVAAGTIGLVLGFLIALFLATYFFAKGKVAIGGHAVT